MRAQGCANFGQNALPVEKLNKKFAKYSELSCEDNNEFLQINAN